MELKNKTVLVTGADGFIGLTLRKPCCKKAAKSRPFILQLVQLLGMAQGYPGQSKPGNRHRGYPGSSLSKNITKDTDLVFNLAALIAIPYSYVAPDSYVDTNIKGTLNICQAALENGGTRVIHTSTSEVYGTAQYVPIDEKHPKQPQSPYSATKIGADAMALSFYNAFNLPVTIARPFNTYGPRQSARAIIPTIITQIASGMKEIRLGDLRPTRDLTM